MSTDNQTPQQPSEFYPERFFIVGLTSVRYARIMLYMREGWIREMVVYTKPYNKAVYTKLKLHPKINDIAPLEVREWIKYNTTPDEAAAKDVYLANQRLRRG